VKFTDNVSIFKFSDIHMIGQALVWIAPYLFFGIQQSEQGRILKTQYAAGSAEDHFAFSIQWREGLFADAIGHHKQSVGS
jgi:hypothetical protein